MASLTWMITPMRGHACVTAPLEPARMLGCMTTCPVCEHATRPTRLRVITDRTYRVRVCSQCGLAATFPRPTPEQLEHFYGVEYFEANTPFGYDDYSGDSLAEINAERYWHELPSWVPEVANLHPRRLLDVGGATGGFAYAAAGAGWDAAVVEVGDSARAAAEAKGLRAVARMDDAGGTYSLITMFHVVEHLIDPTETLRQARQLIADDGVLVIEVPQWRSMGRLVRRRRWAQLKPPEHINFFTPASIRVALSSAGWTVERATTIYPRAGQRAMTQLRDRDLRGTVSWAARWAVGTVGLGAYLRVVARPTG